MPPLLAGVCFGLGYGVVQRLMAIEFPQLVQLGQAFEVREFPGTTLEALRLKTGAEAQSIRGDLDVLELEEQKKEKTKPIEKALEPAPLIQPLPPEQRRFSEPLDREPDPEPLQQEFVEEEAPPELPDQLTP
jgi:hypothetical protein